MKTAEVRIFRYQLQRRIRDKRTQIDGLWPVLGGCEKECTIKVSSVPPPETPDPLNPCSMDRAHEAANVFAGRPWPQFQPGHVRYPPAQPGPDRSGGPQDDVFDLLSGWHPPQKPTSPPPAEPPEAELVEPANPCEQ